MKEMRIRWAKKLPPQLLVKLYQSQALGIIDEELLENVGAYLFLRCESIVMIGRNELFCPNCRQRMSFLMHCEVQKGATCSGCGYQCTSKYLMKAFAIEICGKERRWSALKNSTHPIRRRKQQAKRSY